MTPTIPVCPHCGAPLAASRFAATVVCAFCDAVVRIDPSSVSASRFRDAWKEWNARPDGAVSIGDTHWLPERLLAHGEISDVHLARRTRWPSELVVLKILRDANDAPLFDAEVDAIEQLQSEAARHNLNLGARVPSLVAKSDRAVAYRWASGFVHTFESVRERHRGGIPPVAAIWIWRRILEITATLHRCGLVHGAILPQHLLVQNGEHGVRLAGFSCAGAPGTKLRAMSVDYEHVYPSSTKLSTEMDLAMGARCVAYLLGDAPAPLADLLRRTETDPRVDPWELHKKLGELGTSLFGPPAFHPIAMD